MLPGTRGWVPKPGCSTCVQGALAAPLVRVGMCKPNTLVGTLGTGSRLEKPSQVGGGAPPRFLTVLGWKEVKTTPGVDTIPFSADRDEDLHGTWSGSAFGVSWVPVHIE